MAICDPMGKLELARALGLPTEGLMEFRLDCKPNELVTVTATFMVPGDVASRIVREFRLEAVPNEAAGR
jgi:hypothetical protein